VELRNLPSYDPDTHGILMDALDDLRAGVITMHDLDVVCWEWGYEYALFDYKVKTKPYMPLELQKFEGMKRTFKTQMESMSKEAKRKIMEIRFEYLDKCDAVERRNKNAREFLGNMHAHYMGKNPAAAHRIAKEIGEHEKARLRESSENKVA